MRGEIKDIVGKEIVKLSVVLESKHQAAFQEAFAVWQQGPPAVAMKTHQEAVAAKDALQATHLYGRHLVIEWAEEEQSLEAVRRKTARYFSKLSETGPGDGTAKRRKIEETLEGADDGEDNAFEDAFR